MDNASADIFVLKIKDIAIGGVASADGTKACAFAFNVAFMAMDEDQIFKALANGIRRDILRLLEAGPDANALRLSSGKGWSAGDIERTTSLSQAAISAHLSILTEAGLIRAHKFGQWRFYSRDEDNIEKAERLILRALSSTYL